MRIAIVSLTTTARRTGVAEYLINLVEQLQVFDKKNQYFIFVGLDNNYMFDIWASNFKKVMLPISHTPNFLMRPIFHLWLIFALPVWCFFQKISLVHLPNTMFVTGFFPTIVTIHDIVELKTKKYSLLRTWVRKMMIMSAIARSKKILTVSQSSATDLVKLGAKKISVTHLGFNNAYLGFQSDKNVLTKFGLANVQYVLFVGSIVRHKNLPSLIEAFGKLHYDLPMVKLVIVGAPDNDINNVLRVRDRLNLAENVVLVNYVSQEDKLTIMKNCSVFCFISSYEGFGIPILEAQAAGVPVVTNNVSSLPEVAGTGAIFVNPNNLVNDTYEALISLFRDNTIGQKLVEQGYENVSRFSWRDCCLKTINAYEKID